MSSSPSSIAILGCGWLGLPLLQHLIARGHSVRGSSRTPSTLAQIQTAGGLAVSLDLAESEVDASPLLDGAEILIFTVPPGGRTHGEYTTERYLRLLTGLRRALGTYRLPHLIYTSSTGVYGNVAGAIDEEVTPRPTTHSGRAVLAMERMLPELADRVTILRLAGLCGPDRHPGRFYGRAGATVPAGDAPVNLVHREDVLSAVDCCLFSPVAATTVYNVCTAEHPPKGDFYRAGARVLGLPEPAVTPGGTDSKRILSEKLRTERGWQPVFDNPYNFL